MKVPSLARTPQECEECHRWHLETEPCPTLAADHPVRAEREADEDFDVEMTCWRCHFTYGFTSVNGEPPARYTLCPRCGGIARRTA